MLSRPGLENPPLTYGTGNSALIIGAGLAGCAIANVLARHGLHCKIFDKHAIAAGASAIPVAVYRPYPEAADTINSRYYLNSFNRLLTELDRCAHSTHNPRGVLQLIPDAGKWQDHEHWHVIDSTAASKLAATKINSAALYFPEGGTLLPADLCNYWLSNNSHITQHENINVNALKKTDSGWQILNDQKKVIDEGCLVVLANSNNVNDLISQDPLPLVPVRGQLNHFNTREPPQNKPVICGRGHIIPSQSGYWAGATHQRNNRNTATTITDEKTNLQTLKSLCHSLSCNTSVDESWAGIRCTTPDHLPLAGGIPDQSFYKSEYHDLHHGRPTQYFPPAQFLDGLYIFTGLGSRGATQAIYAAECLGDIITGSAQTDSSILRALHPGRFLLKQLRQRPLL